MALIKVAKFDGMVPIMETRNLPDTAASDTDNAWLDAGNLRGFKTSKLVHTLVSGTCQRVFRIPTTIGAMPDSTFSASFWMEFDDEDTDVIRSPIADDSFDRYYWAAPSHVPKYNTKTRILAGDPEFTLGVPAPENAPTITPAGGSGADVSRAYVYTYVTAYGEEGPPSPPTLDTAPTDAVWTIGYADPTVGQAANRNIDAIRIYRTVTGDSGIATYFLVAERALASAAYADANSDTAVSENAQLQSLLWTAPPTGLQGMTLMPNGIIAGFVENSVYFCEPYRPHAWPASYAISVEAPIVGLGVVGQTLIILTTNFPAFATGVNPASMTLTKSSVLEPCLSRGSIATTPEGVYYASQNGLVRATPGNVKLITDRLVSREQWQNNADPYHLRAGRLGSNYFAVNAPRVVSLAGEVQIDTGGDLLLSGQAGAVLLSPQETSDLTPSGVMTGFTGVTWIKDTREIKNVYHDPWTGELFLIYDGGVYQVDPVDVETLEEYSWTSKQYVLNQPMNMACLQVDFTVPTGTAALNETPDTSIDQTLKADQWGLVRVYANGVLKFTTELRTPNKIIKMPAGFKAERWSFEVESRVIVHRLLMASSARELKNA